MSKGLGGKFISLGKPKKLAGGQILILPTVSHTKPPCIIAYFH